MGNQTRSGELTQLGDDSPTRNVFRGIKAGVVGIMLGFAEARDKFGKVGYSPDGLGELVGTGFMVDVQLGLIVTADHVLDRIGRAIAKAKADRAKEPELLILAQLAHGIDPSDGQYTSRWATLYVGSTAQVRNGRVAVLVLEPVPGSALIPGRGPIAQLVLSTDSADEGDTVVACGFPSGLKLYPNGFVSSSFAFGIVGGVAPGPGSPAKDRQHLIVDIPCMPESVGSPVCDTESGQVVGMLMAPYTTAIKVTNGDGPQLVAEVPQSLSYAVDVGEVRAVVSGVRRSLLARRHPPITR